MLDNSMGMQPQNAYRAQEQEKKPKPLPQPQGAQAPQPNAQPQTFATMQQQGYARPAQPNMQANAGAQQQATQAYSQAQQPANAQMSAMPANTQQMTAMPANTQQMTAMPGQGTQATPNGFNGQAPNFNPLDYMVGQMMTPLQQTNFGQQAANTQFQNYTATQAPTFQGAGTNLSSTYGNVGVQGGGGGVDSNYQGGSVNPYGLSQFSAPDSPVAGATQQKVMDLLAKPSGWDSDLVQNMYGTMGRQIDDQFAAQDTAINEEMARRGLYDSSIAAGRLKDSNIAKRSAQTNLADSLLQQMGLNYGNDQARAAGLGAAYQGQQFGEGAQTFGLNQGAEQQQFGQQLGAEQARQGAFGLNQQGQIANSNAGIASMNANLQAQLANQGNALNYAQLNSQNALSNNAQALARAQFMAGENQFGTNTANQNAQQRFANSLTGGQQDFNNSVTGRNMSNDMVQNILNYGQQQFNNDLTQQQFNRQLSNDQWAQLIQSLGIG